MREKKDWTTMSFRMDAKTAERLRAYADKLGQNYTVCLERIINGYLDAKEQENHEEDNKRGEKDEVVRSNSN